MEHYASPLQPCTLDPAGQANASIQEIRQDWYLAVHPVSAGSALARKPGSDHDSAEPPIIHFQTQIREIVGSDITERAFDDDPPSLFRRGPRGFASPERLGRGWSGLKRGEPDAGQQHAWAKAPDKFPGESHADIMRRSRLNHE